MHNERVRSPVSRSALSLVALAAASALVLGGCSGGSDASGGGNDSSASASSPSTPSPSSTVKVPDGTKLTEQGSNLGLDVGARVIFEPSVGHGSVLDLTVDKIRRGRLSDFKGFILDDAYKKNASYYYVSVQVKNVGESDVGGVPVPLWGVNQTNTLLPAVNFTTRFDRCPSQKLPKKFGPGKAISTCLVYLSPGKGKLTGVSYRPSQEFNPITWRGAVLPPAQKQKG